MIINKITTGFVIQEYDTELRKFISQEFIAGDESDYEDLNGNSMEGLMSDFPYLPFEMIQPKEK